MVEYHVLDCGRTARKRVLGIAGRRRVRPCAKTITRDFSPGHIMERLIN